MYRGHHLNMIVSSPDFFLISIFWFWFQMLYDFPTAFWIFFNQIGIEYHAHFTDGKNEIELGGLPCCVINYPLPLPAVSGQHVVQAGGDAPAASSGRPSGRQLPLQPRRPLTSSSLESGASMMCRSMAFARKIT